MKDMDRIRRTQNITKEEDLKPALAKEYLKLEMRMNEEDINSLKIKRVFYDINNPDWNNLYVEFHDIASVSTCYRHAKNLKPNRRIFQYIPRMFYNRYKALDKLAYDLRHSSQPYKTRIRFGIDDIFLLRSLPGSNNWTYMKHDNLPALDIVVAASSGSFSTEIFARKSIN